MIREKKGFTLVEILIVVAIIAILASIVLVGLSSIQARGRDARRISDLGQVQNALALYYTKNGYYPSASTWLQLESALVGPGPGLGLTNIPNDPSSGWSYGYCTPPGDTSKYVLGAYIEDINDPVLQQNNNSLDSICHPSVTGGGSVSACSTKGALTNLYCTTLQ